MNPADLDLIVKLRLLIARAANRDSLAWWDDDALTAPASFILDRTFPHAPLHAARRLALEAARLRHDALCPPQPALHLFRLDQDNSDVQALRSYALYRVDATTAPIATIDALRSELLALTGSPPSWRKVSRGGHDELEIAPSDGQRAAPVMIDLARSLAWAYVEGKPGRAVYPYFLPKRTT
jgi:hypothetical protein